jgi:hypothetical protein
LVTFDRNCPPSAVTSEDFPTACCDNCRTRASGVPSSRRTGRSVNEYSKTGSRVGHRGPPLPSGYVNLKWPQADGSKWPHVISS